MQTYDEATVAARLRSPVHAALMHVLGVTAPTIGADAAAVRLFRGGSVPTADDACIWPPGGLRPAELAAWSDWPLDDRSLFTLIHHRGLQNAAFRMREQLDGLNPADQSRMMQAPGRQAIRDALGLCFTVREPTRGVAVFVKLGTSVEPFGEGATAWLERLRPTLAWAVLAGVQRATHVGLPAGHDESPRPRKLESLDRLSDTERKVLDLLLAGRTERQAAAEIGRSPHTVHVHVKNLYRKLDVTSRRQLRHVVDQVRSA